MLLKSKETTVGYKCPECGSDILGMAGMFTLSAHMFKVKCDCKKSELKVTVSEDTVTGAKKIRLSVPCYICQTEHHYTIGLDTFFTKEILSLGCPYSGIDIAFIGNEGKVKKSMNDATEELIKLMKESGVDLSQNQNPFLGKREASIGDFEIFDIVNFVIKELAEDGAIHCKCEKGEYNTEICEGQIRVVCTKCGAKKDIPADSSIGANAFLSSDELFLE